jgi:hypothetical protein
MQNIEAQLIGVQILKSKQGQKDVAGVLMADVIQTAGKSAVASQATKFVVGQGTLLVLVVE